MNKNILKTTGEDQTSAFNWRNLLIAVGSTLELTETNM